MINIAGGMAAITSLLGKEGLPEGVDNSLLVDCARKMLHEVVYLRDVTAAEIGRLGAVASPVKLDEMVKEIVAFHGDRPEARKVRSDFTRVHGAVVTDPRLLRHALDNLYVNALEACSPGDAVVWESTERDGLMELSVRNPGEIPEDIRKKLFKRYVSTKGQDRGLGLFIARSMVKDHLGGELGVESMAGQTRVFVLLPVQPDPGQVCSVMACP
jgi:signal transduction histidine kinase